ncbi:MAG: hypothetical protein GX907_04870 [Clostridiaceae bacterium]|nr:hypothetical protein [Clostridiaceae bacterium]
MVTTFDMYDIDVQVFMEALDHCKGNVYLRTDEGDYINLKSKLSQIAGLMQLIEGGKVVKAKIECDNVEDVSYLFRLNLFGHQKKPGEESQE